MMQLTALLAELELNIQEAHAFSTTDGFSLDVFVVDGWPYEVLFAVVVFPFPSLLQRFRVVYYLCFIEHKCVRMSIPFEEVILLMDSFALFFQPFTHRIAEAQLFLIIQEVDRLRIALEKEAAKIEVLVFHCKCN